MTATQLNFFNTIMLDGKELNDATLKAKKQNDRILKIMQHTARPMTPFEVHHHYCNIFVECPITSIRRGMTTLTREDKLIKTGFMKEEKYGKINHQWMAS